MFIHTCEDKVEGIFRSGRIGRSYFHRRCVNHITHLHSVPVERANVKCVQMLTADLRTGNCTYVGICCFLIIQLARYPFDVKTTYVVVCITLFYAFIAQRNSI